MSFPGEHTELLYILVSINIHIFIFMDSGHCVCDILDYNTGTWLNFDDDTIPKYSGFPENVYNYLSK